MDHVAAASCDRQRNGMLVRPVSFKAEVELVQRHLTECLALLADEEHQRVRTCKEDVRSGTPLRAYSGEQSRHLDRELVRVIRSTDDLR